MKNIVISLFDPQKDHLPKSPSARELNSWKPSTAFLAEKAIPPVSSYILLVPHEHMAAAERLLPHLKKLLNDRINTALKNNPSTIPLLLSRCSVELKEIEYSNIWSVSKCHQDIKPVLDQLKFPCKNTTIILNLCGGTTAERTSIYLALLSLTRKSKHIHLKIVHDQAAVAPSRAKHNLVITNTGDCLDSIGLLSDGVGTRNNSFRSTLNSIESIVIKSKFEKILLSGATGVGKSYLAKLIIAFRQALDHTVTSENCISLNIAALAPNLIESELFGYAPGAFTGGLKNGKAGIFERANNGIIFLDEIGELPKYLQTKLLTVLDGTPFYRVGGDIPITSRFMLLCGTNKDLFKECCNEGFRYDLLQRISTWHYEIPGLAQRVEDIESILQRFQGEWRDEFKTSIAFENSARETFLEFARHAPWPGNFREFNAMFRHMAMFASNSTISLKDVQREIKVAHMVPTSLSIPAKMNDQPFPENPYNLIDLAQLACAIDVCKKAKSADEAGRILFNARRTESLLNGAKFNGTTYLQRVFQQFSLKANFKNGEFRICQST